MQSYQGQNMPVDAGPASMARQQNYYFNAHGRQATVNAQGPVRLLNPAQINFSHDDPSMPVQQHQNFMQPMAIQ
jgi:hypothetical protein